MTMKAEGVIKNYYKKDKRRNQLECEIEKLEKSNEHLERYSESWSLNDNIEKRININNRLITEKYVEIDNIIKEVSDTEHIISALTEEERNISKLRFESRKEYQAIACEMNMSKSTVCRRIKNIIEKIDILN